MHFNHTIADFWDALKPLPNDDFIFMVVVRFLIYASYVKGTTNLVSSLIFVRP